MSRDAELLAYLSKSELDASSRIVIVPFDAIGPKLERQFSVWLPEGEIRRFEWQP